MIAQSDFPVEPWAVRETSLDLDLLAQSESLFALSNGHLGLRGNFDEGEPHGIPGSYLVGFYELRPLPYAESSYANPESSQSIVNVTNGKLIRLLVDDEPFDVRYGTMHSHERVLDLRAGTMTRTVEWSSPAGKRVRVTLDAAGFVHPARGRGHLTTRSKLLTTRCAWSSSPSSSRMRKSQRSRAIRVRPPRWSAH